jgi:hypothetical protein
MSRQAENIKNDAFAFITSLTDLTPQLTLADPVPPPLTNSSQPSTQPPSPSSKPTDWAPPLPPIYLYSLTDPDAFSEHKGTRPDKSTSSTKLPNPLPSQIPQLNYPRSFLMARTRYNLVSSFRSDSPSSPETESLSSSRMSFDVWRNSITECPTEEDFKNARATYDVRHHPLQKGCDLTRSYKQLRVLYGNALGKLLCIGVFICL